jgi:hypothetical protein
LKSCDSGLFYTILIEIFGPFLLGSISTQFVTNLYKKRQNPNLFSPNPLSTNCLAHILSLFCDLLHRQRLATFSSSSVITLFSFLLTLVCFLFSFVLIPFFLCFASLFCYMFKIWDLIVLFLTCELMHYIIYMY